MILTDDEIKAIYDNEKGGDYYDTVWAIEAAILEKLSSSEPVAYAVINRCYTNPVEHVCTSKQVADSWLEYCKDRSVIPLFTHPPAPSAARDEEMISMVANNRN